MKSALQRRVERLEWAAVQRRPSCSGRVSPQSFVKQVETRMRLKGESLETAFQALVVHLEDHELDGLLAEADAFDAAENLPWIPCGGS